MISEAGFIGTRNLATSGGVLRIVVFVMVSLMIGFFVDWRTVGTVVAVDNSIVIFVVAGLGYAHYRSRRLVRIAKKGSSCSRVLVGGASRGYSGCRGTNGDL